MKKSILLGVLCLWLGLCTAWASTGTTNPNLFNDTIDWCTNYGCQSQQLGTPQNWTSNGGATGMVGLVSSQNMQNLVQGVSWNGNFSNGMGLIYNGVETLGNTPGGILLSLDSPAYGVGAYIQDDPYGAFTATITLYDASFNLLGSYSSPGTSDNNVGTALFIGAYDATADVSYALFDTNDDVFAIGQAKLATQPVSSTPEPGTLALLLPSAMGLAGVLRRRFTKEVR